MASVTWVGAPNTDPVADNEWSFPGGWNGDAVPGSGDTITVLAGSPTLVLTSVPLGTGGPTTGASVTVAAATVNSGASWAIQQYPDTATITGNLEVDGGMSIASDPFDDDSTTVHIGGTLTVTNSGGGFSVGGYLQGGRSGQSGIATTVLVTADAVTNNAGTNNGSIVVDTDVADGSTATLDIATSAAFSGQANTLVGNVSIGTDGTHAGGAGLLEFNGGLITTIQGQTANFGRAQLSIYGSQSFLADSGSTTSNSALAGLTEIDGGLILQAGAAIATNGAVTIGTSGSVSIDKAFLGIAGSSFTVGGGTHTLTVNGGSLSIGRSAMTGIGTVSVGSISSISGSTISLDGADTNDQGRLLVNGTAGFGTTGVLTGNVLMQDSSLLQFALGQITTIAEFASLQFSGGGAFIADSNSTTSNSALTGLTEIDGSLNLQGTSGGGGTHISTSSLTIGSTGNASLDGEFLGTAGSLISVANTLTVNGGLSMGRSAMFGIGEVSAGALQGTGNITVNGSDSTDQGRLIVGGASGFSGTISIDSDGLVEIGTSASGGGTFQFEASTGTVKFDTATSSGDTFDNFVEGDTIDLAGLSFKSSYEAVFSPSNNNATAGTLNIVDTANGNNVVASLALANGNYNVAFTPISDGNNGTAVTISPPPPPPPTTPAGTTADMIMRDGNNGDYEIYDLGSNTILAAYALGQVGLAWQVAGIGAFDAPDTSDMILRNSSNGAFEIYDISNSNLTNAAPMGQVGLEWSVAGFGDFSSRAGETDMLMRNSNTGAFEIYNLANNGIISAAPMGQVGLEWSVAGFGDFSTRPNETDMLMRNTSTGAFYIFDISNNQLISAAPMGAVGLEWSVAGFGDFSGNANETDMLMRNNNTGAFEIYDISNNQLTSAAPMGAVGLAWEVVGFGPIDGAGTSEMLMRNVNTGAFEVYDIANNTLSGFASMGQVGNEWSVAGIATDPPSGAPNSQLVQAMASSFDPAGGALDTGTLAGQPATPTPAPNPFAASTGQVHPA
jgi:hypothetical protein